jgi:O-antigen/teichoic acid export membrane protein
VAERGLLHVMVANVAQQTAAFLTVVLVAKFLPPEEFALVRIALAYIAVATILAAGGITAPILRYCADTMFSRIDRQVLLAFGLRRVTFLSLFVSICALALVAGLVADETQALVYAAYALQLPGLALASVLLVYLQAIQEFRTMAMLQIGIRFATLVVSVVAVYLYGLGGLLVSALALAYLVCVPLLALSRPWFDSHRKVAVPQDFSKLALYSVMGTAVTALGQYVDLIMLDIVGVGKAAIAVYSLATVFFFAAVALGGAVQSVATPMFTALIRDPTMFRERLLRWSLLLTACAIPFSLALVLLAKAVETWFLGSSYAGLSEVLSILMLKFILWSTIAVGGAALVGVGAIRQGAWLAVVTTVLTVAIGLPLCARYGIHGAAWTQALVGLLSAMLILLVLRAEMIRLAQTAAPQSDA